MRIFREADYAAVLQVLNTASSKTVSIIAAAVEAVLKILQKKVQNWLFTEDLKFPNIGK
jgi:hypothetical protein